MKIGIITITDGQNYGNRLQNYALQTSLQKMGLEAETIYRKTFRDKIDFVRIIKNIIKSCIGKYNPYPYLLRKIKFKNFNRRYINFSKYCIGENSAPNDLKREYDYFVCGSDQIWNPLIPICIDDIENGFAQFADYNQRIAYAASFGIGKIPEKFRCEYQRLLNGMKNISVREESGVTIVKELINKEVNHVLDPTLLLSKEEWLEIKEKPRWLEEKPFILTYFLGGQDEKLKTYIKNIAREKNLNIIDLSIEFISNNEIKNNNYFSVDPSEFIWLINKCDLMLTDSFHGSVFSIIFNKPFRVFKRKSVENGNNMNTRIDTLFNLFGLSNYGDLNESIDDLFKCNYGKYRQVIEYEQKRSIEYLKNALLL